MDETTTLEKPAVSQPSPATLSKYGGTPEKWQALLDEQDGVCGVCLTLPSPSKRDGKIRLVLDHEHVRGWKAMAPERRWAYVRGLTCWWCNTAYLARGITLAKAMGVVAYLERYLARRPA